MRTTDDPRFATYPAQPGVDQLRWYIRQAAAGVLTIREFISDFRMVHEAVERAGRANYASQAEGRAIWDVLWAVEFCSEDVSREDNPEDWIIPEEVLVVVKRAVDKLEQ
jgi:hypothetical protein